eukprot:sb/3461243/
MLAAGSESGASGRVILRRLSESVDLLKSMHGNQLLLRKPFLILANKQDTNGALNQQQLSEKLSLSEETDKNVHFEECSAIKSTTDKSIKDGLMWVLKYIYDNYDELLVKVSGDCAVKEQKKKIEREQRQARIKKAREEREKEEAAKKETEQPKKEEESGEDDLVCSPFKPVVKQAFTEEVLSSPEPPQSDGQKTPNKKKKKKKRKGNKITPIHSNEGSLMSLASNNSIEAPKLAPVLPKSNLPSLSPSIVQLERSSLPPIKNAPIQTVVKDNCDVQKVQLSDLVKSEKDDEKPEITVPGIFGNSYVEVEGLEQKPALPMEQVHTIKLDRAKFLESVQLNGNMADRKKFKFTPVEKKYLTFNSKDVRTDLTRWDLANRLSLTSFSYSEHFKDYQAKDFVMDFFTDPNVQQSLKVFSSSRQELVTWGSHEVKEVQSELVPCSITSMDFFDRLTRPGLVRDMGAIYKCLDEDIDGFLVADELHKMILSEESDHWDVYGEEERSEFLFLLFKLLVLGGPVCQYDDGIERYLEVSKALYKEFITVQKNAETKTIEIASRVLKASAWDGEICWFPGDDHHQTFCYLILNPISRICTVISHDFGKGFCTEKWSAMFKSTFQGGTHVEIFSAQGKDPAAKWKQTGKVQRVIIFGNEITPPRERPMYNRGDLATDTVNSNRRIFLSSSYRDISHTPLHTRLPLGMMTRGQWVNLAFNIPSIVSGVFNSTFKSVELISVSASCKLRKVFTMRHQPHNTTTGLYTPMYDGATDMIPKSCSLNVGNTTQVIDMAVIRQWVDNQQPKIQRETVTKSAPQNPLLRNKPIPSRNAHSADHQRKLQGEKDLTPKVKKATKMKREGTKVLGHASRAETSRMESTRLDVSRLDQNSRLESSRLGQSTARLESSRLDQSSRLSRAQRSTNNQNERKSKEQLSISPVLNKGSSFMDRVGDMSLNSTLDSSRSPPLVAPPRNLVGTAENREMIGNITNGNISFSSSSASPRSFGPGDADFHQRPNDPDFHNQRPMGARVAEVVDSSPRKRGGEDNQDQRTGTRGTSRGSRKAGRVYNSKDYEDSNPFAASDEDLKYRMKALALYNGDLDDSMDYSVISRRSKRSLGPVQTTKSGSDEEEIEEKLGEDSDTSTSDATVLSHAQEVLLSGSARHTSFLQDSLGKNHEHRLTDSGGVPTYFVYVFDQSAVFELHSFDTMK